MFAGKVGRLLGDMAGAAQRGHFIRCGNTIRSDRTSGVPMLLTGPMADHASMLRLRHIGNLLSMTRSTRLRRKQWSRQQYREL